MRVGIIGMDSRRNALISKFTNDGYDVNKYCNDDKNNDLVLNSNIIVLPIPMCNGSDINHPLDDMIIDAKYIANKVSKDSLVFAGIVPEYIKKIFNDRNIEYYDYAYDETYLIKNAYYTAEGAIMHAIKDTPFSLRESKIAVIGYGRIGSILSGLLYGFGADVTVYSRSNVSRLKAWSCNIVSHCLCEFDENIKDYNIIFNTAPALIFDKAVLDHMNKNTIIYDLASKPGGGGIKFR